MHPTKMSLPVQTYSNLLKYELLQIKHSNLITTENRILPKNYFKIKSNTDRIINNHYHLTYIPTHQIRCIHLYIEKKKLFPKIHTREMKK